MNPPKTLFSASLGLLGELRCGQKELCQELESHRHHRETCGCSAKGMSGNTRQLWGAAPGRTSRRRRALSWGLKSQLNLTLQRWENISGIHRRENASAKPRMKKGERISRAPRGGQRSPRKEAPGTPEHLPFPPSQATAQFRALHTQVIRRRAVHALYCTCTTTSRAFFPLASFETPCARSMTILFPHRGDGSQRG